MNPILFPPHKEEHQRLEFGSGRYYARMSQVEEVAGPNDETHEARWYFEAFDAAWFDENEPPIGGDRHAFYENARLFGVEAYLRHDRDRWMWPIDNVESVALEDIEDETWLHLETVAAEGTTIPEGTVFSIVYPNLFAAGTPRLIEKIDKTDRETTRRLNQAIDIKDIKDATEAEIDTALIRATAIDSVVVYDVGQGNAIGLCDPRGVVYAYFDIGGGVLANTFTRPPALKDFCFTTDPPIILSHWDFDHWSSAQTTTALRALKATWIAPRQSVGPLHLSLIASIIKAGGKLLLLGSTFPAKWRGNLYLERCTGSGRNHSGIALTISQHLFGGGEQMLFPGDSRYHCIPSFAAALRPSYFSAVAPHHGADMRNRTVPNCRSDPSSRLVYSFGTGNTFGHPRRVTRNDHHSALWRDPSISGPPPYEVRETANRVPPLLLGHVLLSWSIPASSPLLPCAGRCQLQPIQL